MTATVARAGWIASAVLASSLLASCVPDGGEPPDAEDATPEAGDGTGEARGGEAREGAGVGARVDGQAIVLVDDDGTETAVIRLDRPADGVPLHASVRPGDHDEVTVLALARVDNDEVGPLYELRYLTVRDGEATDLYWFPWRLQVDEGLAAVEDTPPTPAWAPDGSALAWVEWDARTTRLRTVGWRSDPSVSNPSDDAHEFELDGVPPGAQLDAWGVGPDGLPRLTAVRGDERWEIRVDRRAGMAVAMPLGDDLTGR